MNIILNAIQAMESRGTLTIMTQLIERLAEKGSETQKTAKKRVQIQFKDTGCGIRQEDLGKIFEPFFSTKGGQQGAGLGLTICQDIIRLHHGTMQVESMFGRGATFTIFLPVPAE
jgi:signal transduction histidine kinase